MGFWRINRSFPAKQRKRYPRDRNGIIRALKSDKKIKAPDIIRMYDTKRRELEMKLERQGPAPHTKAVMGAGGRAFRPLQRSSL